MHCLVVLSSDHKMDWGHLPGILIFQNAVRRDTCKFQLNFTLLKPSCYFLFSPIDEAALWLKDVLPRSRTNWSHKDRGIGHIHRQATWHSFISNILRLYSTGVKFSATYIIVFMWLKAVEPNVKWASISIYQTGSPHNTPLSHDVVGWCFQHICWLHNQVGLDETPTRF